MFRQRLSSGWEPSFRWWWLIVPNRTHISSVRVSIRSRDTPRINKQAPSRNTFFTRKPRQDTITRARHRQDQDQNQDTNDGKIKKEVTFRLWTNQSLPLSQQKPYQLLCECYNSIKLLGTPWEDSQNKVKKKMDGSNAGFPMRRSHMKQNIQPPGCGFAPQNPLASKTVRLSFEL